MSEFQVPPAYSWNLKVKTWKSHPKCVCLFGLSHSPEVNTYARLLTSYASDVARSPVWKIHLAYVCIFPARPMMHWFTRTNWHYYKPITWAGNRGSTSHYVTWQPLSHTHPPQKRNLFFFNTCLLWKAYPSFIQKSRAIAPPTRPGSSLNPGAIGRTRNGLLRLIGAIVTTE